MSSSDRRPVLTVKVARGLEHVAAFGCRRTGSLSGDADGMDHLSREEHDDWDAASVYIDRLRAWSELRALRRKRERAREQAYNDLNGPLDGGALKQG